MAPQTLKPLTPGYPAPMSCLLGTTSLARVVGADRELLLFVRHKQQIPSVRICPCARKVEVADDVLEVTLLIGPEDKLPFLHGNQLVKMTHSHHLHQIVIQVRPPRKLHPMLTKARRMLTPTMVYAVIGIAVETPGSAIALVSWL